MIMRVWHGYTARGENARRYEELLREVILPGIHRVEGYRGAYLSTRDVGEETEFVTVTLWESMAAIRRFAGEEYARAVIHEEARPLLTRYDESSIHYETTFVA
jgi:heme-degrading monooxygenase HmoA